MQTKTINSKHYNNDDNNNNNDNNDNNKHSPDGKNMATIPVIFTKFEA